MKNIISALAVIGLVAPAAMTTSAQASYAYHCHYCIVRPHVVAYKPVVTYKKVYVKSVHYLPIFATHCHCYVKHVNHHAPYPNVFVENAHVYVPPSYYFSPYSYVNSVLVHRSYEMGPTDGSTTVASSVVAVVLP